MKQNPATFRWLLASAVILSTLAICPTSLAAPTDKSPANATIKERESWDILLMQGKRLGYVHTTVKFTTEAGRTVVQTEAVARMSLRRGDDTAQQLMRVMSVETPEGHLIRYESEMGLGPTPIRAKGQVKNDRLEIETTGADGTTKKTSLPWPADCLGPFPEQSLLSKPMKPGETRTVKALMTEFQRVAEIKMTAKDYEPCKLLTGTHDLLRIESVVQLANNQKLEQTIWADRTGDVLKTFMPAAGGIETYRATKAEAIDKTDDAKLDLLPSMLVKIDKPLANGHKTKQVTYRVHLDGSDPAGVFISGPTQSVKSIDANTADVTVYSIRPGQPGGNPNAPADPPTADEREPNVFIQSNDPLDRRRRQESRRRRKRPLAQSRSRSKDSSIAK